MGGMSPMRINEVVEEEDDKSELMGAFGNQIRPLRLEQKINDSLFEDQSVQNKQAQ